MSANPNHGPQPGGGISNYNLFGETAEMADVVHCETIAARSVQHDWQLSPHRHARLHQVLVLTSGGGVARIENEDLPLGPSVAVNMPAGAVHGFQFDPGTEGWVLTLPADLVDQILRPAEGLWSELRQPRVEPGAKALVAPMKLLFAEYEDRSYARAQMLRMLTGQILALLARHLASPSGAGKGAQHPLFRRLEALIEARFAERLSVTEVARALAVSPQHLSRVAREATGQPVSALIAARSHREARRLLTYTNLAIQQVAFRLGYADPAHFSRVFARESGVSPRAFRAAMEAP
ncbi:helix-turn-helix domain-containing protein [Oceanicola sp. 502str15]|uniref:helix-turn-helix domain-containing protein n=1 Tax=Oceanicola sp. 502str15 TaxID=2696061 RepID=UPI0020952E13|nr:helix-turn-helix domain-containing protein [Oceanicola sp. 502str15]